MTIIPPNIPLIPGTVARIYKEEPIMNPHLQIIYSKFMDCDQNGQPRWKIALSDSVNFIQAVALSPLHPVFEQKKVQSGHIVKVTKYSMAMLKGHQIMLVGEIDVDSVVRVEGKIGEPTNVESVMTKETPQAVEPVSVKPPQPILQSSYQQQQSKQMQSAGYQPAPGGLVTGHVEPQTLAPNQYPPQTHQTSINPYNSSNFSSFPPPQPQHQQAPTLSGYNWEQAQGPAANCFGAAAKHQEEMTTPEPSMVVPIAALSPYQNTWTIKARITQKSEIKNWANAKGTGKLFNVTLLDQSGEIRASGFNDAVNKFYDILQEGSIYYISGGSVKLANQKFNNVSCAYEISLDNSTTIILCNDSASSIPTVKFNFTPIKLVGESDKDVMVDIIGIVHEVGDLGSVTVKSTGKLLSKRELTLVDNSQYSVKVTLWGREAEDFVDLKNHPVIALKQARITEFMGSKGLTTQKSTGLLTNPDIPEAHELRGWYDTTGAGQIMSAVGAASTQKNASNMTDERKFISHIKDENLGTREKPDFISVLATITYIRSEGNVSYAACPSEGCNKKVIEEGPSMWRCEKCQKVFDRCDYRYIMSCQIGDETGQTWVNLFNETAEVILGISANEMSRLRHEDEDAYKKVFEAAQLKTYLFRCKIIQEFYNGESKIRQNIVTAVPVNFVQESSRLAEKIEQVI